MPRSHAAYALSLFVLAAAPLHARIAIIQGDDGSSAQEAVQAALKAAPGSVKAGLKGMEETLKGADAVIAVGDAAAAALLPLGHPCVAVLVSEGAGLPKGSSRVSLLPDPFTLIGKVKDVVPRVDHLGALVPPKSYRGYLKYLASAGKITGTELVSREVDGPGDLVNALRAFAGHVDALWVAPDPAFIAADRWRLISEFCLANRIALIAPVCQLAQAGALAGVAPGFDELGRSAADAAQHLAAGKPVGAVVQPSRCEVRISARVAKALGFVVPAKAGTVVDAP
jgi:ABC-type uncharacterized transport system substrate-binding protein